MSVEYIELNMANYDEEEVSQLNDWGIWASHEIERLQKERTERIARDCAMDEVDELMDCIHSDHTFEDLDKHKPCDMQTTIGSTLAWLMHRCYQAEKEVQRIKDAKNPLFAKAQLYSKLIEMKELLDKLDQSPSEVIRGTTSDDPAFNDLQ